MMIPMFKGVNDEDPESFLKNYKKTCIRIGSRIMKNLVTFLPKFLKRNACQWHEKQPEATKVF